MTHIMIDLETLGTTADSAIISIGAVEFNPNIGEIDNINAFYTRVDWGSAMIRRTVNADTLQWWMKQSDDARKEVIKKGVTMNTALEQLTEWLPHDAIVWGNGAAFDISMLEHAYQQRKMELPWKFWNVRDCRTIEALARGIVDKKEIARSGTHHSALDDAIYQATYISKMWMALRGITQ